MGNLFAELKRRHIYRVAAAYAVVAWVLLQLVNNVVPLLHLPDWAGTLFLVFLLVGFPVALLFAWIHQLAPADGATAPAVTSKLDWALMGALVVVIGLVSYEQLAPGARTALPQQATTAPPASQAANAAISVAVLPFLNLSGDPNQEFFSDGMTEEITSALAKIPGLLVVGRTSAFQFKGQNKDLSAIGQALHATHLIEGSVRKDGNQVRITAQLIKVENGTHLWTESYDRELKGIFAVQEDIAQAIAVALRVPLGMKQGESLVSSRTDDTESYQDYLRAKALMSRRSVANSVVEPTGLLEQVVARDPNYAPAWALLAQAYTVAPNYDIVWLQGSTVELRRVADAALPKAEAAARRAIELDPRNADAYAALGAARAFRGRLLEAEDLLKQALKLDPVNPNALHWYSQLVAAVGRLKESLAMRQQLRSLEPLVPVFNSSTDRILWLDGQNEAALAIAQALPSDYGNRVRDLALIHASMGRYKEAADAVLTTLPGTYAPGTVEAAVRLLRMAPAPASRQDMPNSGGLDFIYLYVGAPERAFEFAERNVEAGYNTLTFIYWHSSYAPARNTNRFKTLMRKAGLVEYWRSRGWPDLCRPVGADDFACD